MSCIQLKSCVSPAFPGTKRCINIADSPAVKSLLRSMKALEWGIRILTEELSAFWHFWILKRKITTRQSWSLISQNKSTQQNEQRNNKRMHNLPVSEVTDSGHRGVGDSKDVWNHVSIEAVGVFYTLLTPFMRYKIPTLNVTNWGFVLWPSSRDVHEYFCSKHSG